MDDAQLIVGDARQLPLPDASVALVVTSPPYFGLRDYGSPNEIGTEPTPAEYVDAMRAVLRELGRVLRPDGNVFLVIGDKYARNGGVDRKPRGGDHGDPTGRTHLRPQQRGVPGVRNGSLIGIPFRVAIAAIDDGWLWRQEIIWNKLDPLPESVRRRCVRAHETVLHLTKQAKHYAAPVQRGGGLGRDVWDLATQGYRDPLGERHPAVYPEKLVAQIVANWSRIGDLVLDPFAGSGTTLVVARRMGRPSVGVELNPAYAALAARRLQISSSQTELPLAEALGAA